MEHPLGHRRSKTDEHIRKHPLTAYTVPAEPTSVFGGMNWYSNFDNPVYDHITRKFWVGRGNLGFIRGGHAIAFKPPSLIDPVSWWKYYDQGQEGACVGFSISHGSSLHNRVRYQARWLYQKAQEIDEWDDTPPEEGTSVRAGLEVLRTLGHVKTARFRFFQGDTPKIEHGIEAYKWATSVEQIVEVLGSQEYLNRVGGIPFLNSWGKDYPHIVYMPFEVVDRLIREDGEFGLVTDRK